MAGDWLQIRHDLREDPSVIAITEAVEGLADEDHTCGKLLRIWTWADRQTIDGNARSVTAAYVDRYVGVPGFAQAMADAEWLTIISDGITFPKFDRYISETAKTRALTARRARKSRAKSNAQSVTASVTKSAPREEKSREEKSKDTYAPDSEPSRPRKKKTYPAEFEAWWVAFPKARRVDKAKTCEAWLLAQSGIALAHGFETRTEAAAYLMEVTERFAASPAAQNPRYVQHSFRWLAASRYDDDPSQWEIDQTEGNKHGNTGKPLGQGGRVHQRKWGPSGVEAEETGGHDETHD